MAGSQARKELPVACLTCCLPLDKRLPVMLHFHLCRVATLLENLSHLMIFPRIKFQLSLSPAMSRETGHHHHQSLNREGRWGTTDNFATSFLHFPLFSTALWDLPNSRPVHLCAQFNSVQSLNRLGRRGYMTGDSADILF